LVLEDDEGLRFYVRELLASAGYETQCCGTVAEARRSFLANPPDLIVADIDLPDGNGMELCRELGVGLNSDVRLIFLTGSGEMKLRLQAFRLGAHDYMVKPFAAEEFLARVQIHLANKKTSDELARQTQEVELRQRLRQTVTNMLVHDLRNPLTVIKGTLDLTLRRGLITEPQHRNLLASADNAADLMILMLNDILDIGQAERGTLKANISSVQLDPLMLKIRDIFEPECKKRQVRLESRVAPEAACLETDSNFLFRLLANLVFQALKVSPKGETVLLECARPGGRPRLTVADRGPKLTDEEKKNCFPKPGGQDSRCAPSLGLTFCSVAAEVLKGDIRVENRPDGGRLYILDLPAAAPAQG